MIPSASTTYELGILPGCNTSGSLPLGSWATVSDQLGRELRNVCALSLSSSTETAMIWTPFSLRRPAISSRSGISSMHGAHHDAQMSTSTTLPFSDPRSILPPPSKRLTTTDGIGPPTLPPLRLCFLAGVAVSSRPASEEAHPPDTATAK